MSRVYSEGGPMSPDTTTVQVKVKLPTKDEFLGRYAHYTAVDGDEQFLWDIIVTGENAVAAATATSLGVPAVSVVADRITAACAARRLPLTGFRKQLSGAIVCSLMMANGFAPTGKKGSVGRTGWNRGELYRPK